MSDIQLRRFLEVKEFYDGMKYVPVRSAYILLEDRLEYQLKIEELEKQLLHAIKTGGEYLEIKNVLN